jgi:hypothetical protein
MWDAARRRSIPSVSLRLTSIPWLIEVAIYTIFVITSSALDSHGNTLGYGRIEHCTPDHICVRIGSIVFGIRSIGIFSSIHFCAMNAQKGARELHVVEPKFLYFSKRIDRVNHGSFTIESPFLSASRCMFSIA